MTLPGFHADASLDGTGVHYRSAGAFLQASGVTAQLPHLFCRVTDCPCQKAACVRGGGVVVPSRQLPCFFTCRLR